jgi:hypothetical protein
MATDSISSVASAERFSGTEELADSANELGDSAAADSTVSLDDGTAEAADTSFTGTGCS